MNVNTFLIIIEYYYYSFLMYYECHAIPLSPTCAKLDDLPALY